jgi:hypothetical protein
MKNSSFWPLQYGLGENHIERTAKVEEISDLAVKTIVAHEPMSQKEAEAFVRQLPPIKNTKDERIAEIPVNTIGKILRHKGYDISRIIKHISSFYKTSLLLWSEFGIPRKNHKIHWNIIEYHHYLNKFSDGISEFNIRITIFEEKAKIGKKGKNYIHSIAISDIATNKNGEGLDRFRVINPGVKDSSPFIDIKLQQFFESVKRNG